MSNDGPPDNWDDVSSTDCAENSLLVQASNLRAAWILAVRNHVQRQTGEQCKYNSNIRWDGGLCRETRRNYQPVWPKLVAAAKSEGLDPIRLVGVLFAAWSNPQSPNSPKLILSTENIARYHKHLRNKEQKAGLTLKTDEAIYRSAVWSANQTIPDPDAAVRFVLNDLSRKMSPLFRYSVAVMRNMTDVATKWRSLAMDQMAQAPEGYLETWSKIIPQDITAAASAASGKVA